MKILYIVMKYDYGDPKRGFSDLHYDLYNPLVKMNGGSNEVIYFPFDEIMQKVGQDKMNEKLLETVYREKPDFRFFFLLGEEIKKDTIKEITENTNSITFNWFTDDRWRFDNFSKYRAPLFNWVATTDLDASLKYKKIGYKNAIKTQWACNNFVYKPLNLPKIYEVTFIGQPHGDRKEIVNKIRKNGIDIKCWGQGWPNGRVSQEEMIRIFSQSKINLNFAKSSGEISLKYIAKIFLKKEVDKSIRVDNPRNWVNNIKSLLARRRKQIKSRNFEVPGCGGFLLTDYVEGLEEYYKIGKEIVCSRNIEDLVDKIKYYLKHDKERENIAKAGYERTLRDHTFEKRFDEIFKTINLTK